MIQVTTHITGVEEVRRDLARLRLDAIQAEVGAILDDMAEDAASYPPERPNQRYARTNKLHDGWLDAEPVFDLQGDTLLATLTNPEPHGPWVQGEDQAEIHVDRWRTTEQIMDAWEARVAARIEDALDRVIGP